VTEHPNAIVVRAVYEAVERGDLPTFAGLLDHDIVWHESTPGFEGDYHGHDETLALLGRVFEETGVELSDVSIQNVLADDGHAVALLEITMTLDDRHHTGRYVDLYRLRDGKLTEHWHLPLDPNADQRFFGG
jgi:ketosteroid isomerase-like protein